MDLKLKIAQEEGYSLLVISSQETQVIDSSDESMIADAIIGQVLAHRDFSSKIHSLVASEQQKIDSLSPSEAHEYVQDLVLQQEVMSEMDHDPVVREAARLEWELWNRGAIRSVTSGSVDPPGVPQADWLREPELFTRRIQALKEAKQVGWRTRVQTKDGEESSTIWLRNFDSIGVSADAVADNVAKYLTLKKVWRKYSRTSPKRAV